MSDYYRDEDLSRFAEIGKSRPELFKKFMEWYNASLEPGALTKREKVLIALGVAFSLPKEIGDGLHEDKGFDVADFVTELRRRRVTPHIAIQDHLTKTGKRRKTKIDGRTTRHPGYGLSLRIRKRNRERRVRAPPAPLRD